MKLLIETESEQAAIDLTNEILDDVSGKKVEDWYHCLRPVKGTESSCIYHYTEKDVTEDNKRIKFYIHESGANVCLKQIWREGYTPGRQTKLHLTAALINMIYTRYPEKFSGFKIQW
ncbi:MAG: hypothetical protein J6T38_02135 [Bacteroidaceae bacterium]|nr:hypothetical protein [Bacteroidaceae bacterium]